VSDKARNRYREEHLRRLGVTPEQIAAQPSITPILKRAKLQRDAIDYLRMSEESDARNFLVIHDKLSETARKLVSLEAIAIAAGLTTQRLFGLISEAVFVQSRFESALLAAANHPQVVEASIKQAVTPRGVADRKMLHQQAGFLPMPKTQIVSLPGARIDARQQVANISVLPPMESSVRRMSDRFGTRLLESSLEPRDSGEFDNPKLEPSDYQEEDECADPE
jgi:hypothetical protein